MRNYSLEIEEIARELQQVVEERAAEKAAERFIPSSITGENKEEWIRGWVAGDMGLTGGSCGHISEYFVRGYLYGTDNIGWASDYWKLRIKEYDIDQPIIQKDMGSLIEHSDICVAQPWQGTDMMPAPDSGLALPGERLESTTTYMASGEIIAWTLKFYTTKHGFQQKTGEKNWREIHLPQYLKESKLTLEVLEI